MRVVRDIVVYETIEEIAHPGRAALLVIDVQNDEMSPEGSMARHGKDIGYMRRILAPLRYLIASAREHGVPVVYTLSTKSSDARFESGNTLRFVGRNRDVGIWDYKLEGTWGNEVAEELEPLPGERRFVKYRSSAFVGTPMDQYLRNNGIETGIVVGTATEGCVEATVRSLQDHSYYPVIVSDCVTSRNQELHQAALTVMSGRWDVIESAELGTLWSNAVADRPRAETDKRLQDTGRPKG
jgi:nicotinamidase-related amidase